MAKRSKRQQSIHDKVVKKSADYYLRLGYKVKADIKGFDRPNTISKKRPDLIAKNGKEIVILEVETEETVEKDRKQQNVFQQYALRNQRVRFRRKIAK